MGVIIYGFNLNISPKMSYGVLECDIVIEFHVYDFVIKSSVICARPGILGMAIIFPVTGIFCFERRSWASQAAVLARGGLRGES